MIKGKRRLNKGSTISAGGPEGVAGSPGSGGGGGGMGGGGIASEGGA